MTQEGPSSSGAGSTGHRLAGIVSALLVAGAIGAGFFAARRPAPAARPTAPSTPVSPTTASVQPGQGDGPAGRASILPAATAGPSPTLDPAELAVGADVYENLCVSCHGDRGEGQPNWWVALPNGSYPASPHDASGHTWHHSDVELERIVREGGRIYLPQSTMPAYGHVLRPDEIRAVIVYLKSFWGPRERAVQADISREVEGLASPATETNPGP